MGAISFFPKIFLFSRLDTTIKAMVVPVDIPGHLPTQEVPVVVIGVARRTPAAPPPLPPVLHVNLCTCTHIHTCSRCYKPPGPTGRQRASTTSHHQPTYPTTVTPGGVGTSWMPRQVHHDLVRGCRDPIPADMYCSGAVCPFFRDIT